VESINQFCCLFIGIGSGREVSIKQANQSTSLRKKERKN